jgi:prepilin-type N-terminal cleavage/methylation domain-containing protein
MRIHQRATRPGFTLIEMMVATALILVILLIISQAFASASRTMSTLRTAGTQQERLRGGITLVRRDLISDHFGPPSSPHLSQQRLDQNGWQPPYAGYFEIQNGTGYSTYEPALVALTDGEGLPSTRSTNHWMRFTVFLPLGIPSELFSAQCHPFFSNDINVNSFPNTSGVLYSRWAEVAYFLVSMGVGEDTKGDGTGLQRYTLRRKMRLLSPKNVDYPIKGPTNGATLTQANAALIVAQSQAFTDVVPPYIYQKSAGPDGLVLRMPGPEALNVPDIDAQTGLSITRIGGNAWYSGLPPAASPAGDDIVMTDVTSCEIKAAWFNNVVYFNQSAGASPFPRSMGSAPPNFDEPFDDLPQSTLQPQRLGGRVFDTGTQNFPNTTAGPSDWGAPLLTPGSTTVPSRINIRAIQIKLRIWDPRVGQTRQATVEQEV